MAKFLHGVHSQWTPCFQHFNWMFAVRDFTFDTSSEVILLLDPSNHGDCSY
jgi:hypothetical protein